jgi:predicted  nucleic acid-binding Zn-ribbon protein
MNVSDQLVALSKISLVEKEMVSFEQAIKLLPQPAQAADTEKESIQKRYFQLANDYDLLLAERRQLERNLAEEKDKIRKWQARAELIRKEREYTALMSEIGGQKRLINGLEDQILEKMQGLEEVETPLREAEDKLEEAKDAAATAWSKINEELAAKKAKLAAHTTTRDELLDALPKDLVARFHRIANNRGNAIAMVTKEVCGQCRYKIPPHTCQQIYRGEAIEHCPSCQRLMVSEFNMEVAAVPAEQQVEQNA